MARAIHRQENLTIFARICENISLVLTIVYESKGRN